MADDPFASYTCSFKAKDGTESDSGIIVHIDPEDLRQLLQEPSCLKTKVGDNLSADKPCYALITAHSCASHTPDEPAVERLKLAGRKIVVGNARNPPFEIPIDDFTIQCRAVSCCGKDSIMRLTEEPTLFTVMPHTRQCHMGFDFLILFFRADAVNERKPSVYPDPPTLSLTQCRQFFTTSPTNTSTTSYMLWRRSGGMVEKAEVSLKRPQSVPEVQRLRDEVDLFLAKRSVAYQAKGVEPQVIGAPIVLCTEGESYLIGINTGTEVTTIQGIFELLKGGIIPFLAVMRHANPRSLLPSQWKEHVTSHVKSLSPHYMWDLLHHLLEGKTGIRILKVNPGGYPLDISAGLEILTTVFDNLKTRSGVPFDDYHQSDGEVCMCMNILYSGHGFIKQYLALFAEDDNEHAIKMVEAFFQCFESMLNCESIARKLLSENIEHLIKIATSQLYVSNDVVNKCFNTILLKERTYLIEKVSRHYARCDFYVHRNEPEHYRRNRLLSVPERDAMLVHGRLHNMRSSHSECDLVEDSGLSEASSQSNTGLYSQSREEHGHK